MSSIRILPILAGLACLADTTACITERTPPVLQPEVQLGPGARARPRRVLVLSASCGSMEFRCPKGYIDTVDNIVRGSMEFAGYDVIDPETLRNQTRQRHENRVEHESTHDESTEVHDAPNWAPDRTVTSTSHSQDWSATRTTDLDGPGFEDLTVAERRALLAEAGADAVLVVRIAIGAENGVWTSHQNAEVMVKLGVDSGDTMAWASRCMASSNDFASVTAALEGAARCAVGGGSRR